MVRPEENGKLLGYPLGRQEARWLRGSLTGTSIVYPDHRKRWMASRLLLGKASFSMPEDARGLQRDSMNPCPIVVAPQGLGSRSRGRESNHAGASAHPVSVLSKPSDRRAYSHMGHRRSYTALSGSRQIKSGCRLLSGGATRGEWQSSSGTLWGDRRPGTTARAQPGSKTETYCERPPCLPKGCPS